jgi:leader peptidase (prepilin peptidase)/N-methyltransferase
MVGMPTEIVLVWFFLLGCIIGSFLNVVIYRLHTGRTIGGRSHCPSCGGVLKSMHLVPILSYLALRGRCAYCRARISPQYMLVELLTGGLFAFVAFAVEDPILRVLYLVLMAVFVVILVYDLRHTVIPDEGIFAAIGAVLLIALYGVFQGDDAWALILRLLGALFGFMFFAVLWSVSEGRWVGFGDAKLAIPLGLLVAWPAALSALVLSFWVGAALSLALLGVQSVLRRGQARLRFIPRLLTMKSEIPFAPFLILGFLLTHFFSFNAFALPYHLLF